MAFPPEANHLLYHSRTGKHIDRPVVMTGARSKDSQQCGVAANGLPICMGKGTVPLMNRITKLGVVI